MVQRSTAAVQSNLRLKVIPIPFSVWVTDAPQNFPRILISSAHHYNVLCTRVVMGFHWCGSTWQEDVPRARDSKDPLKHLRSLSSEPL